MTIVGGKPLGTGLRRVQIFELDTNGYPKAISPTAVYEGYQIVGGKAFSLNIPDARIISHTGDDRNLARDFLPPLDSMTCELRVARLDYDILAILTNTKVVTEGEVKMIGIATDQQGYEPQLGLFMFQQALDGVTGARNWRGFIMPKARIYPKPMGMQEGPSEHVFQALPYDVSKHLWGSSFALLTEGFLQAPIVELNAVGQPWIVAWKADNIETFFSFDVARPAVSTDKIHAVWVDGVEDLTVAKTTLKVTPTAKPTSGQMVVCLYEIT